ncbi:MAG: hypothetical protein J4473_02660 [Candidatus Aenigmarchaeota archaeon]|nr:hypothetical protein [Candidatus Aenigmarchaeota archaeon]
MFDHVFRQIPVIINDCYGDPLLPIQIDNTLDKLDALTEHSGPISIITKMKVKPEIGTILKEHIRSNVLLFYSFTGLDEGGFSFEERERSFEILCDSVQNLVMYLRPIIRGRNDSHENIRRICDIARNANKPVVYGGFKPHGSRKRILFSETENFIKDYQNRYGIEIFPKTSCATARILGLDCYAHTDREPENIDVLDFLDYEYNIDPDGKIIMLSGASGDRNFIRFLTRSNPRIVGIYDTTNILSISENENIYEATSSWFLWSRNISTCLGCYYCMIPDMDHLRYPVPIGCNPVDLGLKNKE